MQAVIQRVIAGKVEVGGSSIAQIDKGLLVLLGIHRGDTRDLAVKMASKIIEMRIFEDENGKMNRDVSDIGGAILAVPQFTLAGDTSKGRRPSFDTAAAPSEAEPLFRVFAESAARAGIPVEKGAFREHMHVSLTNDGPVTFVLQLP